MHIRAARLGMSALALGAFLLAGAAEGQTTAKRHRTPEREPETAAPASRSVEFVNRQAARIVSIYVSASRDHDWGDDLLGDDELDRDSSTTVTYRGPCRVDVRIDMEGGASESRRFVDVCRFPSLVLEPGWTLKPLTSA